MNTRIAHQKNRTPPTLKQKRFAHEYVKNGGNATKAALEAYDGVDYSSAKSMAMQNLQKPVVQEEINIILKKVHMTPEYALERLDKVINSGLGVKARNSDSLKGIEMLFKLHNAFPNKRTEHVSKSVRLHLSSQSFVDAQAELQKLHELSASLLAELKSTS